MRKVIDRHACLWLMVASFVASGTPAENIDPDNDQSQYAWSENAGWINAEPSGHGGDGVEVGDFELTGWMWSENVGWISMSCKNTSSCDAVAYGVRNDGRGTLSGDAWSENAGWIRFRPSYGGVGIDVSTGEFAGEAWSENLGWIRFASDGPTAFGVRTAWNCDPLPPVPTGSPVVGTDRVGGIDRLVWSAVSGATGFDIVRGDLGTLRSTGGNYAIATLACVAENTTATRLAIPVDPTTGTGHWYLVRPVNCGGIGSYESTGGGQVGLRGPEIQASSRDCVTP